MQIPILNIYYLLSYAWDKLDEKSVIPVGQVDNDNVLNLLGRVLCGGVRHLFTKGLDRGYVVEQEETSRLRGRINFGESLKRYFLRRPQLHCEYDELSYDVLRNQILKSTLKILVYNNNVDRKTCVEARGLYLSLAGVSEIKLTNRTFRLIQDNANSRFYDFLMKVCGLIVWKALPTEQDGGGKFTDFLQDEKRMAALFENFVRNFYRREQHKYQVGATPISWDASPRDEKSSKVLPGMITDICLTSPESMIVIDTKYCRETLVEHRGKEMIRPEHLYQLFAYIMNLETKCDQRKSLLGILLYPTVDRDHDYEYEIRGYKVLIKTINLNQDWRQIHQDLLDIVN